jgi:hypothetical protein
MYSYCNVYVFLFLYLCILIVMFMYSYCYVYVFLLLCFKPTGIFPLPRLSLFGAFASALSQPSVRSYLCTGATEIIGLLLSPNCLNKKIGSYRPRNFAYPTWRIAPSNLWQIGFVQNAQNYNVYKTPDRVSTSAYLAHRIVSCDI